MPLIWQGRFPDTLAVSREGIQIGREHRLLVPLLRCLWSEGVARAGVGEYEAALRALEEGLGFPRVALVLRRYGDRVALPHGQVTQAQPVQEVGEPALLLSPIPQRGGVRHSWPLARPSGRRPRARAPCHGAGGRCTAR
jgi:hypothetical protein